MLVVVGGIGGCEDDFATTNGEREIGRCFGENPDGGFGGDGGVHLVADVVNGGGGSVVRRDREMGGVVVALVGHVAHGGAVGGVIRCSGSRGVTVAEGVIGFVMVRRRRPRRRGSGVIEVRRRHVRGVEHVSLRRGAAEEGWLRLRRRGLGRADEGVSRGRVNGRPFVVVVVAAVVVVVVEGKRHGGL